MNETVGEVMERVYLDATPVIYTIQQIPAEEKGVRNRSGQTMARHTHSSIKMRRLSATLRNVASETLPQACGPRRALAMERSASHKI
jgi:hypothetical protein